MPITGTKTGVTGRKNNGGTLVAAGNASSLVNSISSAAINGKNRAYGIVVPLDTTTPTNGDPHGVTRARAGGTFAYTPAPGTNYIIAGAGDNAARVNNTVSSVLATNGGVGRKSINKTTATYRNGAYASTVFNVLAVPNNTLVPGRTRGSNAGDKQNFVTITGANKGTATASDDAASPTRSLPGELTFRFGAKRPTSVGYKSREAAES